MEPSPPMSIQFNITQNERNYTALYFYRKQYFVMLQVLAVVWQPFPNRFESCHL